LPSLKIIVNEREAMVKGALGWIQAGKGTATSPAADAAAVS